MFEGLILYFIVPTVTAVIGGVVTLLINNRMEKKRLAEKAMNEMAKDWAQYEGKWHGVHISRGKDSNKYVLSHHEYELNIAADGSVGGSMRDFLEDPPCEYDVKGRMSEGGLVLDSKCKTRPALVAVEVYTLPMNPFELSGVLVSYDYRVHHPFVSFIVLTRTKLNDSDYVKHVEDLKKERLYLELSQEYSLDAVNKSLALTPASFTNP